jgi:hypothetical protein
MDRCIRRATVDAFWSRETAAVKGLRPVMKTTFKKAGLVEGVGLFPCLGPFPVHDGDGMGSAVLQLLKTLDPGKCEKYVQCETAKNVRTALGAVWEASVESKDQTVIVRDMTKSFVTTNPTKTKSQWFFSRFMEGMHERMGDMRKQDEAISVELMGALMEEFEKDWVRVTSGLEKTDAEAAEVLFPALFLLLAYCGALRGARRGSAVRFCGYERVYRSRTRSSNGGETARCDGLAWTFQKRSRREVPSYAGGTRN